MTLGAALVMAGVAVLLFAEWFERASLRWVGKPLASTGFLLAALGAPSVRLPAGASWLPFAALVLAAAGDVLLVPKTRAWFMAGMASFALAHVLFGAWFLGRGVRYVALAVFAATFLVIGHVVWRWLSPHITGRMRVPVRVYMLVVSLMAACAAAYGASALAAGEPKSLVPALGGLFVYLSDIAVARQRFVARGFANRAWGLPLYYLGQLMLASALLAQ